ncbi:MAG TPA: class I SAM-dependent methyltransferase [Pyrinomonadaceae bacterium]
MNEYQHPPTFATDGDMSAHLEYAAEDYELNVLPHLPQDLSADIIDVGCGWGQFLSWLRNRGFNTLQGIDLGAEQVAQCRSLGFRAEQVIDSAAFLKARPAQFDLVTMHHIIEHVDPFQGLELVRAAYDSLRPNGRIIVQTPNMSATSANFSRYIELTHVTGYTDSSLAEVLQLAGFANVVVFGNRTGVRWRPKRLAWLALQRVSRLLWRAMLFAELGSDAPRTLSKNLYAVASKVEG